MANKWAWFGPNRYVGVIFGGVVSKGQSSVRVCYDAAKLSRSLSLSLSFLVVARCAEDEYIFSLRRSVPLAAPCVAQRSQQTGKKTVGRGTKCVLWCFCWV